MAVTQTGTPLALGTTRTASTNSVSASPVFGQWSGTQPRTAGHLLVAVVIATGTTSAGTTAQNTGTTGWTRLAEGGTGAVRAAIWVKDAAGSDAAPQFTSTIVGTATMTCTLFELAGAQAAASQADRTGTGTSSASAAVSVTTTGTVTSSGELAIGGMGHMRSTAATRTVTATGTGYTLVTSDGTISSTGHTGTVINTAPASGATSTGGISVTGTVTSSSGAGALAVFKAVPPEDSPGLEASGFGSFAGIGSGDTINHVAATVNQYASTTAMGAPTYQLWDGTTAQIGSDATGTVSTSTSNTDSPSWTGVTYSQLATLRLRVTAHQGTAVSGDTQSVDWTGLTVNYTPVVAASLAVTVTTSAAGSVPLPGGTLPVTVTTSAAGTAVRAGAAALAVTAATAASAAPPYIAGLGGVPGAGWFTDQHGDPRLYVADENWALPVNGGEWNGGDWQGDYDAYFAARAAQGFTVLLTAALGDTEFGGSFNNGNTWDGVAPFVTGVNPSSGLNSTYWARIDGLLASAAANGITVNLNIGYTTSIDVSGHCQFGWTTTQCSDWGAALAARYASAPNILWSVGNDYQSTPHDTQFSAMLSGLRGGGDTHPISLHAAPEMTSRLYSDTNAAEAWGVTNAQYNWAYTYNAAYWLIEYAYSETSHGMSALLPVIHGDGYFYQGTSGAAYSSTYDRAMRQDAWHVLSSGGRGFTAGSENIYQWASGSPAAVTGDWYYAHNTANITALVQSLPGWHQLAPDTASALVTAGRGTHASGFASGGGHGQYEPAFTDSYVTASRTPDTGSGSSLALIYLSHGTTITIDQAKMVSGYTASWAAPVTGALTSATAGSTYNSTAKGNNSQGDPDWVLVLQGTAGTAVSGAAALAATVTTSAAGTVTGTAARPVTVTTSATGSTSATAPAAITVAASAAGTATSAAGAALPVTVTTAAAGGGTGTAARAVTVTTSASGTVATSSGASLAVTVTTAAGSTPQGDAARAVTVTTTAAGTAAGSSTRPVTVTTSAAGSTGGTATRAVTVATAAAGAATGTAATAVTVTLAATGIVSAAGTGTAALAIAVTVTATGTIATASAAALPVAVTTAASGTAALSGGSQARVVTVTVTAAGIVPQAVRKAASSATVTAVNGSTSTVTDPRDGTASVTAVATSAPSVS